MLSVFTWALSTRDAVTARSLTFSVLVFAEVFRAFSARSATRVFFETGVFTNVRLLAVVALTAALHIGLLNTPWTREVFGIAPLTLFDGALTVALGLVPATVIELFKLVSRRMQPRDAGTLAPGPLTSSRRRSRRATRESPTA